MIVHNAVQPDSQFLQNRIHVVPVQSLFDLLYRVRHVLGNRLACLKNIESFKLDHTPSPIN